MFCIGNPKLFLRLLLEVAYLILTAAVVCEQPDTSKSGSGCCGSVGATDDGDFNVRDQMRVKAPVESAEYVEGFERGKEREM